jgi:acetylornithine deacetylase/succinyl-diaminopimelate desuccinylase-like protein
MIGLFTPESHLHAPDENFELVMAERAVNVYEKLLERVAGVKEPPLNAPPQSSGLP